MAKGAPAWLNNAVFYEIYPQSFYDTNSDGIGDLQGIIEKLDYVKYLGFNAIWINPCFESPFGDAGYDVADYYKIAPRYGSNEDAERLFSKAHDRGIKVCFDLVAGHSSTANQWFVESAKPESNKYSNWYIWTDSIWTQPPGLAFVAGYSERDACYITNFFHMQPALNYGFADPDPDQPWQLPTDHPDVLAVREEMKNIMRFWLDKGLDGFRVDMAGTLVKGDTDQKKTCEFWTEVRSMYDQDYPEAALIAEWTNPSVSIPAGFHADFLLHGIPEYYALFRREVEHLPVPATPNMHSYFKKEGAGDIVQFLEVYNKFYEDTKDIGYISIISGNHDLSRLAMDRDQQELKVCFAFILTMPGVPFVYMGDEIGMDYMQGLNSKEGGYGRTGSRTPMQWKKGANAGFSEAAADMLYLPVNENGPDVDSQIHDSDSLLETVRALVEIKKSNPALSADGDIEVLYAQRNAYPFVYSRSHAGQRVVVAVNPADRPVEVELSLNCQSINDLLVSGVDLICKENRLHLRMQGVSYGIWQL